LLSVGGSVLSENSDGITPIHLLVSHVQQTDASVALLDLFLNKAGSKAAEIVNKQINGSNVLLNAYAKDRFVQRLLNIPGVDVNAMTEDEGTDYEGKITFIDTETNSGQTLLHLLANCPNNKLDLIKKCIELGANVNATSKDGTPVLHMYTSGTDCQSKYNWRYNDELVLIIHRHGSHILSGYCEEN
jgi:ankyrin repeat protein